MEGTQAGEIPLSLDTFAGKVQFRWVPEAEVSSLGQMPFFIEFLKTSGVFENWVNDCPLQYTSPNAPQKRDVLGTILLSVLAGHWRYAHISALRGDGVNPEEAWALDMDATVKPLYGHQEDAKVGYNPQKPGRPSHVYHSYFMANLRMVMDVEVQAGNQTATSFAQPELWSLLDSLPQASQPRFVRGDCNWGTERAMEGAEQRGLAYVFKLKQSSNVKKLIAKLFGNDHWVDAGQNWQGHDSELQLSGWRKKRRVVVLRRPLREAVAEASKSRKKASKQLSLDLPEALYGGVLYEYAVLVTSLPDEVLTIAQHYRDRGDSENNFDELKNQWGWAGFTTHDRNRCQVMARITALVYNWWTVFMRLGIPEKHAEAITSRPLALHGIARRTRHGNQTKIEVTSTHSKASVITTALNKVSAFLQRLKTTAEQLSQRDRWRLILSAAFQFFLRGRVLGSTGRLVEATG